MINKTIATLSLLLAACTVQTPEETSSTEIEVPKSEICKELTKDPEYNSAVDSYFQQWQLPEGWDIWMKENHDRFCETFYKTKELEQEITIAADMYQDPAKVYKNPSWAVSSEHMKTLETHISLVYPGWDINIIPTMGLESEAKKNIKEQSDVTLYLAYPGTSHIEDNNIFIHYDPIENHELAHVLGLGHDYDTLENIGKGIYSAPGETKCLMDQNWNQFGSPERFALGIRMDIDNSEETSDISEYLNDQYVDDY